jgi:hypothetical protein
LKYEYIVTVRYRTNIGCNAVDVRVNAENMTQALAEASDYVRLRRGVIRIDGGDCRVITYADNNTRPSLN